MPVEAPQSPLHSLAAQVDAFQAAGRYTFTREEVERSSGRSAVATEAALRRLRQRGRIASPRRGFHVIVPLEYREAGSPPASWFIDDLMRFLGRPYYVGLLSAAAIYGAAHQQPMVFQVITSKPTRPARAGRVRIEFHMSRNAERVPAQEVQTETGSMRASTPEATAYDLVRFAPMAGHLNNVATVLSELAEKLDPTALAELAPSYALAEAQRLGFLLDQLGESRLTEPLAAWLGTQRLRPVLLAPSEPTKLQAGDAPWRVIPNVSVEPDL